ncbi:MAG: hypothetical protein KGL39_26130, partial [Patescibacteria group bacterium]|nr:hypothetical protein [Patescibacteria group bacterium]
MPDILYPHIITNRKQSNVNGLNSTDVFWWGAAGDGVTDDTTAIVNAITDIVSRGGGVIYFPGGYTYLCGLIDLSGFADVPLTFKGDGWGSIIKRGSSITAGKGWWNVQPSSGRSSKLLFVDLQFDGAVTATTNLGTRPTDPAFSTILANSTWWIGGNVRNVEFRGVQLQHSGGYFAWIDSRTVGDVDNVLFDTCDFRNNRAFTYLTGGSWQGIHCQMDGITNNYVCKNIRVRNCNFSYNTGIMFWQHAYSVTNGFHENIHFTGCTGNDIGCDFVEMGQADGCTVDDIYVERLGYVSTADDTIGHPAWPTDGAFAVAVDTTGIVRNFQYSGIKVRSPNGCIISGDGLQRGFINGVSGYIPLSGEDAYTIDSVSTMGPSGGGTNVCQGIVFNNSANDANAGHVHVGDLNFFNLGGNLIGFYGVSYCDCHDFRFTVVNSPIAPPAAFGPGPLSNQGSTNNVIRHGTFYYSPSAAAPCIIEDTSYGSFAVNSKNWVGDITVFGNGNAYEFQKSSGTISVSATTFSSNKNALATASAHILQRTGSASGADSALQWSLVEGASSWEHMQLQGYWTANPSPGGTFAQQRGPLLNVSEGGNGGVLSTGGRTTSLIADALVTGKVYSDSFLALTDTTYSDTDANLFSAYHSGSSGPAAVALLRYKGSVGYIEQSVTLSGGSRTWVALGGSSNWQLSTNTLSPIPSFVSGYELVQIPGDFCVSGGDTTGTGINGLHLYFYSNVGYISSTQSGTANRALVIQGSTFTLQANGTNIIYLAGGNAYVNTTSDDGSGAVLQVNGFVSATTGYYSASTSYQAFKCLTGGINTNSGSFAGYIGLASNSSVTQTSGDNWSGTSTTAPGVLYFYASNWYFKVGSGASTLGDTATLNANLFNASGTSTTTIQAASGGISGKWLIASDSLFWIAESAPALSSSGQARVYFDSTSHLLMASLNGGAYTALSTGSTPPGGSSTQVQYNSSGSFA